MAMAEVQPLGLGPRTRQSTATRDMAATAAGGGDEERQWEPPLLYFLALPVVLPLPVAVSRMDAGVPRKARTSCPRAKPSGWWAFRLPVPQVKEAKNSPEEAGSPRPQRMRVCLGLGAPSLPDLNAAAAPVMERPAKKARRCVQCGSAETSQWRSGPMGWSTLCNACGVRLRAAGALREIEHRPPPATPARKVAEPPPPPPPESPSSDSQPDSPICECLAPPGDVYLVRKQPKRERRTPRKEAAPAIYLVKKKKPSKKPWRPRNTGQRCLHCGTTSTPQWREGPMGRHTLCNACGVRYRQGRLLPEYRPAASPTFVPSEHASRHREVVQLHRQRQSNEKQHTKRPKPVVDYDGLPDQRVGGTGNSGDDKNNVFLLRRQRPDKDRYPPTPLHRLLPQPVDDDPRVGGGNNGSAVGGVAGCGGGNDVTDAPNSVDSLLLDGPSAPLIVDGDEFSVS